MKLIALTAAAGALLLTTTGSQAALMATFDPLSTSLSYYAPADGVNVGTGVYDEHVKGSDPGVRTSPFGDNSTYYDSVGANADVIFGQGPSIAATARAAYTNGPSSSSFATGNNSFQFVWGSPDDYNVLTFYNNGLDVGSFQLNAGTSPVTLGTGGYIATVTGMGSFNGVEFQSQGANAFEFAGISPVPLPSGLPMFGAALLVLGAFGLKMRRKSAAART